MPCSFLTEEARENASGYSADYVALGRNARQLLTSRIQSNPLCKVSIKFRGRAPARKRSVAKKEPPSSRSVTVASSSAPSTINQYGHSNPISNKWRKRGVKPNDGIGESDDDSESDNSAVSYRDTHERSKIATEIHSGIPSSTKLEARAHNGRRGAKDDDSESSEDGNIDVDIRPRLLTSCEMLAVRSQKQDTALRKRNVIAPRLRRLGNVKLQRELQKRLKDFWEERAAMHGTAMYHLCGDSEIIALAIHVPETVHQLKQLDKWGTTKLKKHGEAVIEVILAFLTEKQVKLNGEFRPGEFHPGEDKDQNDALDAPLHDCADGKCKNQGRFYDNAGFEDD